jgi:hypothetical protein
VLLVDIVRHTVHDNVYQIYINREKSNVDTLLHLVGYFFMNCAMMHGFKNIKTYWCDEDPFLFVKTT